VFSFYYNINDFKQIHAAIRRKWSGTTSLQVLLAFHPFYNFNFKLQTAVHQNSEISTWKGPASGGGASGTRMREVACPTCTVHLQVQVPTSGSETVECGVCQHAFLVSAN